MSEAIYETTTSWGQPLPLPLIDLTTDADGPLLRLCALLGRLQALTEELEAVTASLPARTVLGRRMKEMAL